MGGVLLHHCSCRRPRLLRGPPSTVHSPVRQAIALAARLGCQLVQIICMLMDRMSHGATAPKVPRILPYTLSKARSVWLAHTVNVCLSYRVGRCGGETAARCHSQLASLHSPGH
jgi:hypothetical protein